MSSGNLSEIFHDCDWESVQDADSDFLSLPSGYYTAAVIQAEVKSSKNKPGSKYLELRLQVASGPHQNRLLFDRITLTNRNEVAVNIGRAAIKQLKTACGVEELIDSSQFVGKVVEIKVARKEDNSEYADRDGFRNDVKSYFAVGSSPVATGHSESVADNPAPQQDLEDAAW